MPAQPGNQSSRPVPVFIFIFSFSPNSHFVQRQIVRSEGTYACVYAPFIVLFLFLGPWQCRAAAAGCLRQFSPFACTACIKVGMTQRFVTHLEELQATGCLGCPRAQRVWERAVSVRKAVPSAQSPAEPCVVWPTNKAHLIFFRSSWLLGSLQNQGYSSLSVEMFNFYNNPAACGARILFSDSRSPLWRSEQKGPTRTSPQVVH